MLAQLCSRSIGRVISGIFWISRRMMRFACLRILILIPMSKLQVSTPSTLSFVILGFDMDLTLLGREEDGVLREY